MAALRSIVVAGPTAAGKSALALELAERLGGEIVSADSRQVYRYMDIGTAKPTAEERARVAHHLLDVVMPDERFDAARYRALASRAVEDVSTRGRVPIVVGGTGLYIRALLGGLFTAPAAIPPLRRALERIESGRPGTLHDWCRRLDPAVADRVHRNDVVRLVRALEVVFATGEKLSTQHARHGFGERLGRALYLVVDPGVEELAGAIRVRSRELFERGLVEEVRSLGERGFGPDLPVLGTIGYFEAGCVLRGERTREQATEDLVRSTLRFAKRQRTWFRAEQGSLWLHPSDRTRVLDEVRRFLG